jgi:DNA polymerase elongation subunit (family B)
MTLALDIELYHNFLLVVFKDVETGVVYRFQKSPNRSLDNHGLISMLRSNLTVGFNSKDFDLPLIQLALRGFTTEQLKECADEIIQQGMSASAFADKYDLPRASWNHIDLIQVAPLKASLKTYAGRLHCKKMQDLPIEPSATITAETAEQLFEYCCNDLENTIALFHELNEQITLREKMSKEYDQDLRSRSDAQVAERIITSELRKLTGTYPGRPQNLEGTEYNYKIPTYISYHQPQLVSMLDMIRETKFTVGPKGSIVLPKSLSDLQLKVGRSRYTLGIGGLHSNESSCYHKASKKILLVDNDVASYYPMIIITQGLYPKHLGPAFLTVYQSIVDRRLVAKKAGDKSTAESLKIAVNGSFGKLGNKWSMLYAPDLLIQVTLTGQLALLLLIEMMEDADIGVISANTDGITIKCHVSLYDQMKAIVAKWQEMTAFTMEEAQYSALYSKDVNNYIAIKTDGTVKGKGLYANPWEKPGANIFKLHKNPSTTIIIEAVIKFLRDGVDIEKTVRECQDITKFIAVRKVEGGADKENEYLGKAIRWYYSTTSRQGVINYKKSGYKVPKSEGAKPLMELPDTLPADINYDWYVRESKAILANVGYTQRNLFEEIAA